MSDYSWLGTLETMAAFVLVVWFIAELFEGK